MCTCRLFQTVQVDAEGETLTVFSYILCFKRVISDWIFPWRRLLKPWPPLLETILTTYRIEPFSGDTREAKLTRESWWFCRVTVRNTCAGWLDGQRGPTAGRAWGPPRSSPQTRTRLGRSHLQVGHHNVNTFPKPCGNVTFKPDQDTSVQVYRSDSPD